ncbi:MAG: TniB family NTP-binding protein [Gaiellaceae bacterium]
MTDLRHPASPPDLTTKEGWREFVDTAPSKPPSRPGPAEWKAMTSPARAAFNRARNAHHNSLGPIAAAAMTRVHAALQRQVDANFQHPSGARPGTVIDGEANIGKSTILTQFGRRYELTVRKRYPSGLTAAGDELLPVLYLSLAAGTTIKQLSGQILDFFGYPRRAGSSQIELTTHAKNVLRRCQTTLVLFDDIHFLRLSNQSDRAVNDHLKYLASVIPATFVYAGIDCEQGGLLREGKGRMDKSAFSQTGSRFSYFRVDKFGIEPGQQARDWIELLAGLERQLVLLNQSKGMLSHGLPRYLFDRTHGEIGSLMALIRQGAAIAIANGEEQITSTLLDGITLSYDAEVESRRRGTRTRTHVHSQRTPVQGPKKRAGGRAR